MYHPNNTPPKHVAALIKECQYFEPCDHTDYVEPGTKLTWDSPYYGKVQFTVLNGEQNNIDFQLKVESMERSDEDMNPGDVSYFAKGPILHPVK